MCTAMQLLNGLGLSSNTYMSNRGGTMKSTHHFRDQLAVISGWFEQWNDCEQTVALFSLVKKLGPTHARFLALVLDQSLAHCVELQILEREANDPAYINNLSNASKEAAVTHLLSHLPLLRPGNEEAKAQYLGLIPKVLAHSIRHAVHIEESRQLLSYSLIHPAISNDDRCSLTLWLRQLEDRIHNYPPPAAPYTNGVALNGGQQQQPQPTTPDAQFGMRLDLWRPGALIGLNGGVDINGYNMANGMNSNSLPPGVGSQHMSLHGMNSAPSGGMSSHPDGTQTLPMQSSCSRLRRSTSLNGAQSDGSVEADGPHAPLSPQSSVTSSGSGSESQRDEKDVFSQDGSGMKDVPCWLKGLRLHKYSYLFKNMSYEEMMSTTEEKLEKMNITKGARHKIVLSIQKLRERQGCLRSLEKDLQDGEGSIRTALNEIKSMLQTPVKAFRRDTEEACSGGGSESSGSDPPSSPPSPSPGECGEAQVAEGDLTGQITRLMGKLCSSILISPSQDENLNFFVMLIDKCLSHEAFSPVHKRRLFSWKQQIQKACHPLPPRRSLDNRQRSKWGAYHNGNVPLEHEVALRRRVPVQFTQPPPQRMPLRQGAPFSAPQRNPLSAVIKRPSLQDHMKPHVQIQRTNSAPVRPNPLPMSMFGKNEGLEANDPELNIRLESLCLSVTEHALGSFDGAVPLF